MLLRTEKFFREFFKLKSYWMYLDRSGTAKIMRKTIPAREIVVLLYKKRNCGFCATIWNCRARVVETNIYEQGSMAVPSPRHHLVSKHTRCYFAQVRRVMDRQDHQLPKSLAITSPNNKISPNTNSQNHPSPRSRDTKIMKYWDHQTPISTATKSQNSKTIKGSIWLNIQQGRH